MTRSKKKINIYRSESISSIIRRPITSGEDIAKLAKKLGIQVKIGWAADYDRSLETNPNIGQIINIDADKVGGTHWCATYMDKYFDPFGLPPANRKLAHLNWTPLQIQDIDYGHCGQYSTIWLKYVMNGEEDKFYALFNPENLR